MDRSRTLLNASAVLLWLKDEQTACVKAIYEGKDEFLWLPTGFGKSMCYEVLPFVFDDKQNHWLLKLDKDETRKNPCKTPIVYYNLYVRSATLSTYVGLLLYVIVAPPILRLRT